MKYQHFTAIHGDNIMRTLLTIRERMGDSWTHSMARYAISKSGKIQSVKWRERASNGVPYVKHSFVQI